MPTRSVASHRAPQAIGPYSQAKLVERPDGSTLYTAGQIALDPASMELVQGDVRAQTEQVMRNLEGVLAAAGMTFADVVKTTVFLVDLADFAAMNEVYARRFQAEFPARSTIQVAALPRGSRIEVEVHAVKHPPAARRSPTARRPARRKSRVSAAKASPRKAAKPARKVKTGPRRKGR